MALVNRSLLLGFQRNINIKMFKHPNGDKYTTYIRDDNKKEDDQ